MIERALTLIFGSKHERDIKKILPYVEAINALEPQIKKMSNEELTGQTARLKERLKAGETLDDILPDAFATVREAAWRSLGLRHFDVQLIGGIVLHNGKIAEMKTGEGKTLTATGSIYLNALSGKGVHIVTVNDYLARRDAAWMRPIYDLLGVTVGVIQHDLDYAERKHAYSCDITYGTNNELGFDYLRDNMVTEAEHRVQRPFNYAIVDEVDSILIDEARTPLIISGPTDENTDRYVTVDRAIRELLRNEDDAPPPPPVFVEPGKEEPHVIRGFFYDIDEKSRNAMLTEAGVRRMEEILGVENLYAPDSVELVAHTSQALKAHLIYKDEVDYVVREGEVIIVDEHTGRLMEGRRYSDGLHQAIEAKEKVEIKQETQTLASITFQNFFRIYPKLSGMTGTADTEADEFKKIYRLEVIVIPTNLPICRIDSPDRVYRTEREKFDAIVEEIESCIERKQPVLVGTISIEKSEMLSNLLRKSGINHNVLNAKQHQREAEVVENAGKPGGVTVATNMAGRGTDIVLGGAPIYLKELEKLESEEFDQVAENFKESMLKKDFEQAKKHAAQLSSQAKIKDAQQILDMAAIWLDNHKLVKESGGLHIIGTERHESRRIDNQLRGRSGRQGDPGSSRFYLSLEDNLMRIFGGQRIMGVMEKLGMSEGQELEAGMVDRAIARAQKRVESHNFDIRKHLLEYDDVMNRQREYVYAERNKILDNINVRETIFEWTEEIIEDHVMEFCYNNDPQSWDIDSLNIWIQGNLGVASSIRHEQFQRSNKAQLECFNFIRDAAVKEYNNKIELVGEEPINYVERRITLDVIDARWKEHLYVMDHLREGIWAISYSEKNPLVEYKLEGFRLFDQLVKTIKEQVIEFLFKMQIEGPVEKKEENTPVRNVGQAVHTSLDGFSQEALGHSGPIIDNSTARGVRNAPTVASSAGGASRRKHSRKRRK